VWIGAFHSDMRVRTLKRLSALVHASETNESLLELQRIGFLSFNVQQEVSEAQRSRRRVAASSKFDDFVYDTGFASQVLQPNSMPKSHVRFGLRRLSIVICVLVLAFGASMLAFSLRDSSRGDSAFRNGSSKHSYSWVSGHGTPKPLSSTARGSEASTLGAARCISESVDAVSSIRNWDVSVNRFPRSWQVLNDVALGGVEQIVVRPECVFASKEVLVINLLREQNHWKLKSAAPAGPHF
jgi:hypothetical protein